MSIEKLFDYWYDPQSGTNQNITDKLEDNDLKEIGNDVIKEFELDKRSRSEWEQVMDKAMKIAQQVFEIKNTPWPNAANVKFPLIAGAAIQFAARTYPEFIKDNKVVHAAVLGDDPTGDSEKLAGLISRHMSYQLLVESDNWEEETDKLLHMLPVLGTVFKKTYYDPLTLHNCSEVCSPKELIVNNNIKSIETARRISHVIYLHDNDLLSGMASGIYKEYDVKDFTEPMMGEDDPDKLHEFIEQHRFLDLDDDGYQEPYIVTVHKHTRKVIRIVSRWDMEDVQVYKDKIIKIEPICYFTDFHFLPNPDGTYYSLGFGKLLYPLNHTINTLLNQLIDAGTLANSPPILMARGVRIRGGDLKYLPGEIKTVEGSVGQALQQNMFPIPFKEPSPTLFQLLGLMIQTGKDLSTVTDIMTGQEQAQNVPATTIMTLVKQGLVVFTGVQKRLHRAFKKEFEKLFRLNRLYLNEDRLLNATIDQVPISRKDYESDKVVVKPISDPNLSTDALRLVRAQAIMGMVQMLSPAGQQEALLLYFRELQVPDNIIQRLLTPNNAPNPEMVKANVEAQRDHVKLQLDAAQVNLQEKELSLRDKELSITALEKAAQAEKTKADAILDLAQAKQADAQFRIDAYINALGKLDNEKGPSYNQIKPLLDMLMNSGGNNENNSGGGAGMAQPNGNQAPVQTPGGNPPTVPG